MMVTNTQYFCDHCKCEVQEKKYYNVEASLVAYKGSNYLGEIPDNYLREDLDLCDKCYKEIISGWKKIMRRENGKTKGSD